MKNKFFLMLLPILLVLQIWFNYLTFHYPLLGILAANSNQNEWVIENIDSNVQILNLGLQIGDVILKVDDHLPNEHLSLRRFRVIEQVQTITISRDGYSFEITTTGKQGPLSSYFYYLFGEIISFCIALLLYLNSSDSRSARFLSFLFLMVGVAFMSLEADTIAVPLAVVLVHIIVMALPFVFLHFLILFFREKGNDRFPHRFLFVFYGIIGLVMLPSISYFTSLPSYPYYEFYHNFTMLYFLFGNVLVIAFLVYTYIKFRKETSYISNIIKTIWVAFFVSFLPLGLLSFLPKIMLHEEIVNPYITGMFTLFFPLSFCYLLISKKMFDIELIMRRVLSTAILSLVPSIIIEGILLLIFQNDFTLERGIFSFLFIVTIISILLYSLEYFMTNFEARLFPRKHTMQAALKKISTDLGFIHSFRELKDMILVDIINTLQVVGGAIVFQYDSNMEIIDEGDIDHNQIMQAVALHAAVDIPYTVYEVNRHEEYTSYLVLAPKKTNTLFHQEEIQWLKVIISNLSTSLENLYLIRKLNLRLQELATHLPNEKESKNLIWLRKTMFDLQEKERIRIAADLHDTTMQDIFFIQRKLKTFQKESARILNTKPISDIIHHLDIVNVTLRQNCFELNPHTLETVGLLSTITNLIETESSLSMFELSFYTDEDHRVEDKDMESKRHIFRVVQELMNNAKKHSRASKVTFSCTSSDTHFFLEYQDDGVGFDRLNTSLNHGIGMEQMRSRVQSIRGTLDMHTSKGQGMIVQITVPLYEGEMTA